MNGFKSNGTKRITEERLRQINGEGWTPEHDLEHENKELSAAALCYLEYFIWNYGASNPSIHWPWEKSWWKPSDDPIRNLERAGALIAAEIDRLHSLKINSD